MKNRITNKILTLTKVALLVYTKRSLFLQMFIHMMNICAEDGDPCQQNITSVFQSFCPGHNILSPHCEAEIVQI